MEFDSTDSARVNCGAALLDEAYPGWREKIDWQRLNMQLADQCILGQLYADYDYGLSILGLNRDDAITHGFICEMDLAYELGDDGEYYCAGCRKLADIWKSLA